MRITKPLKFQSSSHSSACIHRAVHSLSEFSNGLDYTAYGRLIQHCTDHNLVRQAKQLHARIVLSSTVPGNYIASKLVIFYSKSNHLSEARYLFDQIPQKNTFSWNAMLIAYSLHNMPAETLNLFSSVISSPSMDVVPDNFTISCVLKALSALFSEARLAKMVNCYILRHGLDKDAFVVNGLITCYSRSGEIDLARMVFEKMCERDVVSWNSMIAGYSQAGYSEECKGLYRKMLMAEGLKPNETTVVIVLQACAQSKDLILGMEVHRFVVENEIKMDLTLCNAIIGLYAKCGSLDYAQLLFQDLSEKDEITYGSMISGYMAHGFVDRALALLQEMKNPDLSTWNAAISGLGQNNRHEGALDLVRHMRRSGFKPNAVTLSSLLPSVSYFSNLRGGKEAHGYAIRNRYDRNVFVETSIIDIYSKSGFLEGARRVFDQSNHDSVIIWTAMISAYAAYGNGPAALNLLDEMLSNGTRPDSVTFTAVLAACVHSGLVDKAWEIFNAMLPEFGIQPLIEHYACMVGVLSRAGRLSEATEFISKMPIEPSAKVWGALLNGASLRGNVELGEYICGHLFNMEPENTGNYITMANLYLQAGRWEEAERVREKMKTSGLKKIPGSSWIETNEGPKRFISMDLSNERTEDILGMLNNLLGLMREEGYSFQDDLNEECAYCWNS